MHRRGFARSIAIIEENQPSIAPSVRCTLDILMQDILASPHQDAAWTKGLLNAAGTPLEYSFSSLSDDLRYTVEVGGPHLPPRRRLGRINELVASLGWGDGCLEVIREFQSVQESGSLNWGAWLGVRHNPARDLPGYKVYVETPLEEVIAVTGMMEDYSVTPPLLSEGAPQLVLIGKSPESERCEFYFELPKRGLTFESLRRLLGRIGLEERLETLVDLIRSSALCPPAEARGHLPNAQFGFSYSVLPDARDPVFSIFAFASDFLGGDGIVRHQMLTAALRRGWKLGMYPHITEPVADQLFRSTYHNIVSFIVAASKIAGMQVSLSPPPQEI